jgi:hypothetical protein
MAFLELLKYNKKSPLKLICFKGTNNKNQFTDILF